MCGVWIKAIGHSHQRCLQIACHFHMCWAKGPPLSTAQQIVGEGSERSRGKKKRRGRRERRGEEGGGRGDRKRRRVEGKGRRKEKMGLKEGIASLTSHR